MCGIVGVIGQGAAQKAFEGLKALEYRGYDSWGIAAPQADGSFYIERHVGKIGGARLGNAPDSNIAIGHTRWATHGKVLEKNAHPHLSMGGKIAIVHNGIVENFAGLKAGLEKKGYAFKSETDSEVIANLVEDMLKNGNGFEEAVRKSLLLLEGYYAIAAIRPGGKKIVCARSGSPLVLGIGKNESFVASDVIAFLGHTKSAVFLEDSAMAVLENGKGVRIIDVASQKVIAPKITEISWNIEQAKKGDYAHFMLKEIFEQPGAIIVAAEQPDEKISRLASLIKKAGRVYLAGCGSSYHACICGSYFFSKIAGVQAIPVLASEYQLQSPFFNGKTLVIGVSQSGETADLLEALRAAKSKGAKIAGIVNVMDSSIMRLSDCPIMMNVGPEICVLSTKSYTAQLSVLLLLAHSLVGKDAECKNMLRAAAGVISGSLKGLNAQMKSLAKILAKSKDIFVIGRQEAFPSALEAALKIKEVSYIHAEGFAGGELKHGTIALVEEGTPVIALATPQTRQAILSNAIEMKSRGAFVVGVDCEPSEIYDCHVKIDDCAEADPIMLAIPAQLLAYNLALERGCDPDKPKNLAKSVTVK